MELEEDEDVEKNKLSSQRMESERERRQVACLWDYVPRPTVGWEYRKE